VDTRPTAFVTGATGFLGLNIVDALIESGWRVFALHRPTSNTRRLASRPVILIEGDIRYYASLDSGMPHSCDAVFHVAGNTSFWSVRNTQQRADNVDGTRHVVEAALAKRAKRFVHTSSISAWGAPDRSPFDETSPLHGDVSSVNYERTKFDGELQVLQAIERGLSAVIMNPGVTIGRYDEHGWSSLLRLVHDGRLPGVPPGMASFCEARAVARAHVSAAVRGRVGERYLLGGHDASYLELVKTIGELLGKRVPDKVLPLSVLSAMARVSLWGSYVTRRPPAITPEAVTVLRRPQLAICDKAIQELRYEPVSLRQMLESAYAWMIDEGILPPPRAHASVP
jgi:nucleoside-diphosphate-sugar epimerase